MKTRVRSTIRVIVQVRSTLKPTEAKGRTRLSRGLLLVRLSGWSSSLTALAMRSLTCRCDWSRIQRSHRHPCRSSCLACMLRTLLLVHVPGSAACDSQALCLQKAPSNVLICYTTTNLPLHYSLRLFSGFCISLIHCCLKEPGHFYSFCIFGR